MNSCPQIILLANYNTAINQQLYTVAAQLPAEALAINRQAFFGSILGTFNHLLVGDLIWLRRFTTITQLPQPTRLNEILYADFNELWRQRTALDAVIEAWVHTLTESDLAATLTYTNMKGVVANKNFFSLLLHFFTHQIHHRGQITTLLSQAGLDFGETDLLLSIPNL